MMNLVRRLVGTKNDRELKRLVPYVERINQLEPALSKLSDAALAARTADFKQRLANGEPLDQLIPETFATVREAMKRTIGKRHFDVQLLGGIILHEGTIAEMKTGEGKTFVATLPAYLNALTGKGVHVVTVNDYLARRDSAWMGEIHNFLGLSVGCIVHDLSDLERKRAYGSDITYGTNNEFGFDYLRDNMKSNLEYCVQRELNYAIVDEVDSILIDEARTPLIISGPSEDNTELYKVANQVIPRLGAGTKGDVKTGTAEKGDYWVDEEHHQATLTEEGVHKVEQMLRIENLYEPQVLPVLHAVNQALIAHTLKKRDVDYVVQRSDKSGKPEVIIVDEFTGRLMPGRRWSDGLHQAVEAREGIPIQSESQTYASITFQNYFRMYDKLAGMTGTADTEAPEFAKIYDLDVIVAPTNRPMIRKDLADVVYKTEREKFDAVIEDIKQRNAKGQPVLVGTISIENSERLSSRLGKRGVKHNVLNAKQHDREAEIVAQAGRFASVTISTNMAGRGTDILLGGNPEYMALAKCGGDKSHADYPRLNAEFEAQCAKEREQVIAAGGLHILGTERHESRRIDNQLRGRAGRQGDPGSSQFYLSLEDDLMRIFGGDKIKPWMERLGLQDGEAIEHGMVTRSIQNAQKKVESRNFDMRKHLLDYDNVMNLQRQSFYTKRREVLGSGDVHEEMREIVEGVLVAHLGQAWPERGQPAEEELANLCVTIERQFGVHFDAAAPPFRPVADRETLGRAVLEKLMGLLEEKKKRCDALSEQHRELGYPSFTDYEREILLRVSDRQWKDHLHAMDGLREGVSLRGYAQKDPKLEYQREGFQLFEEMGQRVDHEVAELVFKFVLPDPSQLRPPPPAPVARREAAAPQAQPGGARPGLPQSRPSPRRARVATTRVRAGAGRSTRSAAARTSSKRSAQRAAGERRHHLCRSAAAGARVKLRALPAVAGFRFAGVRCGIKRRGLDLALLVSDRPASAAGVFTQSTVPGAPVVLSRARLRSGRARAIVVNSGVSNVAMGAAGMRAAERMSALAAAALGLPAREVLCASTGVIGMPLPLDKIAAGIGRAVPALSATGLPAAARAIMTTDTRAKAVGARFRVGGRRCAVAGIAKGSGMLQPRMATMLAFFATDAAVAPAYLRRLWREVADETLNRVTIDGETSTSDSAVILANGASGARRITGAKSPGAAALRAALLDVAGTLARELARDGEGATKLVTVDVSGARNDAEAELAARRIANSLLVKTALFGGDPNWGRILQTIGAGRVKLALARTEVRLGGVAVFQRGASTGTAARARAGRKLRAPEVEIAVRLGAGRGRCRIWTCDLSYEYVRVNADYTT